MLESLPSSVTTKPSGLVARTLEVLRNGIRGPAVQYIPDADDQDPVVLPTQFAESAARLRSGTFREQQADRQA